VVGLGGVISELVTKTTPEQVWSQIQERTFYLREALSRLGCSPLHFPEEHQSGIISFTPPTGLDAQSILDACLEQNLVCSLRGGYLRLAPHADTAWPVIEEAVRVLTNIIRPRALLFDSSIPSIAYTHGSMNQPSVSL
jgi:hypothetical protein